MIYLGSDHGGFELKQKIKEWLTEWEIQFEDLGDYQLNPDDDFPDFAAKVAGSIKDPKDRGILICRTGHGMYIAANRFPSVRAVLAVSEESIKRARQDEDVNVLAIAGEFTDQSEAKKYLQTFLNHPFSSEERFVRRIHKLEKMHG